MDIKINEATKNRPEGTRVLNAPAVLVHISNFLDLIKNEKAWDESDRNGITVFKNEDITVVITSLKKDPKQEDIQTEGYSTLYLLSGNLEIKAGDDTKKAVTGDFLLFHPGIYYSILAVEESSYFLAHYNQAYADNKII